MITVDEYRRLKMEVFAKHRPEVVSLATTLAYFERNAPQSAANRTYYAILMAALRPYMRDNEITRDDLQGAAEAVSRMVETMRIVNALGE